MRTTWQWRWLALAVAAMLAGCGGATVSQDHCTHFCLNMRDATVPVMLNQSKGGPAGRQVNAEFLQETTSTAYMTTSPDGYTTTTLDIQSVRTTMPPSLQLKTQLTPRDKFVRIRSMVLKSMISLIPMQGSSGAYFIIEGNAMERIPAPQNRQ